MVMIFWCLISVFAFLLFIVKYDKTHKNYKKKRSFLIYLIISILGGFTAMWFYEMRTNSIGGLKYICLFSIFSLIIVGIVYSIFIKNIYEVEMHTKNNKDNKENNNNSD